MATPQSVSFMMSSPELLNDFENLARERAGGIVSLQLAWSAALNKLASLSNSDDFTRAVANGCQAPRDAELMTLLLAASDRSESLIAEALQTSSYGLDDFLSGVMALCRHLDRDRRKTTLEMVVGYVRCCEDGAADYPGAHSLPEVVDAMLDEHGFSGDN